MLDTPLPIFLVGFAVGSAFASAIATLICFARSRFRGDRMADIEHRFRSLASQVLSESTSQFLHLATERIERASTSGNADLDARKEAVAALVEPLNVALKEAMAKVDALEHSRQREAGALTEELNGFRRAHQNLLQETANLASALRNPSARGRWGELQLRRTVELAGMVNRCDFTEQTSADLDGSRLRPDLIVHLPDSRLVVVDSKCPLDAYLAAHEAREEHVRTEALSRHARHVRDHANRLSQKAYWDQFAGAADFVVMFLPGEAMFSAALEADPGLIEACGANRVVLATPTTLIALLRAVAHGWRQQSLADNAQEISRVGRDLHERIRVFASHLAATGKAINDAAAAHNKALASLERRLAPAARKLAEMGAADDPAELPSPVDSRALMPSDPPTVPNDKN